MYNILSTIYSGVAIPSDETLESSYQGIVDYFNEHPLKKRRLLNHRPELLNYEDLSLLLIYLKLAKNNHSSHELAKMDYIEKLAQIKSMSPNSRYARNCQHKYIMQKLSNRRGFALDLASGGGGNVRAILEETKLDVVASDISYACLEQSYMDITNVDKKRLSLVAFDINHAPFKDKSVQIITSDGALTETMATMDTTKEIYRISSDVFVTLEIFYPEIYLAITKKRSSFFPKGCEISFHKKECLDMLTRANFTVSEENKLSFHCPKRSVSKFIPGQAGDMFPVVDSEVEYIVLECHRKK